MGRGRGRGEREGRWRVRVAAGQVDGYESTDYMDGSICALDVPVGDDDDDDDEGKT